MKLRRLRIDRLAGIGEGFEIRDLDVGLNVVIGPNASGKSSLLRAVRALLYGETASGAVALEADFDDGRGLLRVVRQGRDVSWTQDGREIAPPELPDERFVSCFTIHVEQLLSPGGTEEAIRERVSRILAGGYDLEAVRGAAPFRLSGRHGRKEEGELREAERAFGRALETQREILEEERELDALRTRKERASSSRERAIAVGKALELLASRRRVDSLEHALSEFPAGMDKLVGDESDRLELLRRTLARQTATLDEVSRESRKAGAELEASGLADSDATLAVVTGRGPSLESLRSIEGEIRGVDVAVERAGARLRDAREGLGETKPENPIRIDAQVVHRVERELGQKRELEASRRAIEEQLALSGFAEMDEPTLECLRIARVELSRWLAAPAPTPGAVRSRRLGLLLLAFLALAGVAAGAWLVHWAIALVGLLVLGASAPLLRHPVPRDDRRQESRRRFAETGVAGPSAWEDEPVRARMDELDSEVVAAERSRLDAERRSVLEAKLDDLLSREAKLVRDLSTLADDVGFDPNALDGSFERWLRLLHDCDEAQRRIAELGGERNLLRQRESRLRTDLLEFLGAFGEVPDESSPGSDVLADRWNRLQDCFRQRDGARHDLDKSETARRRAEGEIAATTDAIAALFARTGLEPDDEAGLVSRLERREAWRETVDSLREERAVARDTEKRLGDDSVLFGLLERDDERTLLAQLREADDLAGEYEELADRILSIENRIKNAGAGHDLEQARERVANRKRALGDRLDEELFAVACEFLLCDVEREHVAVSRPPILRRAEEWFARFTSYAFALNGVSSRNGQFVARDNSAAEDRSLEQLSSGTRMQLLLALRLSFALEAERGREPLPIFLDEALTVADPQRFRSVVESVHEFAREQNRQIFYLTAQPHDLREWSAHGVEPKRIRLDELRRLAAAIPRETDLALPPVEEVPEPRGRTAAEYGIALEVPPISVWNDASAAHLFHLLRDDLPLVERLLRRRIVTVGQLRSLLDSDAAPLVLTPEQIENLRFRSGAVAVFLDAYRQGRGRPVARAVLQEAGVSETFIDRLASLVEEQDGDGTALLGAIEARRDERVKNFRSKQSEQLRSFFEEHGYVDSRPPLQLQEIELLVLTSLGSGIENGAISREEVTELTRWLAAALRASGQASACSRGSDGL